MDMVLIMIVVNDGCFLIVRLKDRLEGCFHTKILSTISKLQSHFKGNRLYISNIYRQKENI